MCVRLEQNKMMFKTKGCMKGLVLDLVMLVVVVVVVLGVGVGVGFEIG